jgi:hypothetical protein
MIYTVTLNPALDRELLVPEIVFDTVLRIAPRRPLSLAAFAGPAAAFTAYFVIAAREVTFGWPPEIWGGAIVMAGFTGLGMVALQESGRHEPITATD